MSDPSLGEGEREKLVSKLMAGRSAVAKANRSGDVAALRKARSEVDKAKRELGERGPVWWTDGAPDFNQHMAKNTSYAEWERKLSSAAEDNTSSS